eukprot:TRINITY_DN1634_c0_g2_i1.p2 TRINITY_DN1634_c0_g2~~TRINITY_DN1634_c0_g2_i1.p2  ORF type:complete len:130 (+),score=22.09 TRINITY_DN1634_c0_g2_i1:76-465(+)
MLISDCLKGIFEEELHCLSRPAQVYTLCLDIKERYTDSIISMGKALASQALVQIPRSTSRKEVDVEALVFFFRCNLDCIQSSKLRFILTGNSDPSCICFLVQGVTRERDWWRWWRWRERGGVCREGWWN